MESNDAENDISDIGFTWWKAWGWLGLIVGSLSIFSLANTGLDEFLIFILILNAVLMIMILKLNKYAFLIATVLSLNPIIWIINGIYLKNRWKHPKVNR
jgi:hypothetical protein